MLEVIESTRTRRRIPAVDPAMEGRSTRQAFAARAILLISRKPI
jgi:hypothetical protein